MLGRASTHAGAYGSPWVGSDVYLGAAEANHLVGQWQNVHGPAGAVRGFGRNVQGFGGFGNRYGGYAGAGRGGRFTDYRRQEQPWQRQQQEQQYGQYSQYQGAQPDSPSASFEQDISRQEWEQGHPGEDWEERKRRKREWERQHPGVPFIGVEALMGAAEVAPHLFGIPPRAALVEARPPNMANREPLPMSTGTAPVGVGLTAQITSRPQRVGFRPERLFVSNYSLDGLGATAWTINDITIGNVSQLAQAGNLPGDMFANVAIDSFVTFKTAQTAMDVVLITTYNGTTEGGIPFTGAVIGLSAQG